MRIGLDAKWFYTGPVSTRTILNNLLPRLFEGYPQYEWVIFLDKKDKKNEFPYRNKNIVLKYVWAENNLLSNLFVIPAQLKKFKVDVIVYQTFPSFFSSIPSIAFVHDILFEDYPSFFTWKERLYFKPLFFLAKKAKRIIVTSNYVAQNLVKHKYIKGLSIVDFVPLGVSSRFKPREFHNTETLGKIKKKYVLPNEFILYVGRLNSRKNIDALIKALPFIRNKIISLVIVGKEDWKSSDLTKIISKGEFQKRVIFTGSIPNEDLEAMFALATIFCFPSHAEGFGLPPLEAMASGVPVIVSKTTAMPEICGEAAVYIDPKKSHTITDALNWLLEDEEKYKKLSNAGLERSGLFTWELSAQKFIQSIVKATQQND